MKYLTIIAKTINGEIQEFPKSFTFPCDNVVPQGETIVRDFNVNYDTVATKVFLVRVGEDVFGTQQFDTLAQFDQYKYLNCICCPEESGLCGVTINTCIFTINGCKITINGN